MNLNNKHFRKALKAIDKAGILNIVVFPFIVVGALVDWIFDAE